MFLLPLHLNFNSCSCLAPFLYSELHFLISALVSDLFILALEPNFLDILLFHIISWVIVEVIRATLEPILILEHYLLIIVCEEAVERKTVSRSLLLLKLRLGLCCHFGEG